MGKSNSDKRAVRLDAGSAFLCIGSVLAAGRDGVFGFTMR